MASAVETQRLISLSLGKIARSRGQRGGINLHKNLLVASVLNKARTAFMMENYSYQMSQQRSQIVLTAPIPQPSPVSASSVSSSTELRDGNSLTQQTIELTCHTTLDNECRSSSVDTPTSSQLVSSVSDECTENNMEDLSPATFVSDKENISPSSSTQCSDDFVCESINTTLSQCTSSDQHIEAANQLSLNVQSELTNGQVLCNSSNYISSSSCKQTSSSAISCSPTSVLKRRRDNPDVYLSSSETESPACKKVRVTFSDCSYSTNLSCELSNVNCSGSESESDSEEFMQTSESPQISNLVSMFNSGFSGLSMSSSSSPLDFQSDNSSINHQWSNSENQSLYCSSQVERIGAISSPIVLSA